MRFPNAYRGVKKIWLAEMLMLLAAIVGIVIVIVAAMNGSMVGEDIVISEGVKTPIAVLGIVTAVILLIGFILNLVGLINANNDDSAFRIALLVTILGVVASAISAIWSNNETLNKWMDTAITICSMFASYYDVDQGVEPDHVIDNYAHFYDREALTEFIHGLY